MLFSSTVEYVNMSDATKRSEKASLLTDHREDQPHSIGSNMTVSLLYRWNQLIGESISYWLQRLNQQRCCWLIWGSFFLTKISFAKALVTGDCCHSLDLVWCSAGLCFNTSSCNLSILGHFLGMEPICDTAGFEIYISWKCVNMEVLSLSCSTVS